MAQSPIIFPYADLPSRWGVTSDRQPGRLRIVVPPVPNWRELPRAYFIGLLPLGVSIWMGSISWISHDWTLAPGIAIYGFAFLVVLIMAAFRLHTRLIIDITQHHVAFTSMEPLLGYTSVTWQKSEIGDIKLNPNNGKLLVRITGQSMPEYFISRNREVAEWVVNAVREAAFHGSFDESRQRDDFPAREPARRAKAFRLTLIVPLVTGAVGIAFLCFEKTVPVGVGLLFASGIFVVVAAGITFGTQDKEYFA